MRASFQGIMSYLHANAWELVLQFIFNALKTGFHKELKLVKSNKSFKRMIFLDFHAKSVNKNTLNPFR